MPASQFTHSLSHAECQFTFLSVTFKNQKVRESVGYFFSLSVSLSLSSCLAAVGSMSLSVSLFFCWSVRMSLSVSVT